MAERILDQTLARRGALLGAAAAAFGAAVGTSTRPARGQTELRFERFSGGPLELALDGGRRIAVFATRELHMADTTYRVRAGEGIVGVAGGNDGVQLILATLPGIVAEKVERLNSSTVWADKVEDMRDLGVRLALHAYTEAKRSGFPLRRVRLVGAYGHRNEEADLRWDDIGNDDETGLPLWVAPNGSRYPDQAEDVVSSGPVSPGPTAVPQVAPVAETQPAPVVAPRVSATFTPVPQPVEARQQIPLPRLAQPVDFRPEVPGGMQNLRPQDAPPNTWFHLMTSRGEVDSYGMYFANASDGMTLENRGGLGEIYAKFVSGRTQARLVLGVGTLETFQGRRVIDDKRIGRKGFDSRWPVAINLKGIPNTLVTVYDADTLQALAVGTGNQMGDLLVRLPDNGRRLIVADLEDPSGGAREVFIFGGPDDETVLPINRIDSRR